MAEAVVGESAGPWMVICHHIGCLQAVAGRRRQEKGDPWQPVVDHHM